MIYDATTRIAEAALCLRARIGRIAGAARASGLHGRARPRRDLAACRIRRELTSARVVIEALAARHPLTVTTNSETGRALAQDWGLPARLAPLDLPGALARFLDAARPALAITVEGEFWPLRSRLLAERGIRQAMIGRACRNGRRAPGRGFRASSGRCWDASRPCRRRIRAARRAF